MTRLLALLLALLLATPALAFEDTSEEIRLPTGSDRLLIANSLSGDQSKEYRFDARAGQSIALRLETMGLGSFALVGPDGSPLFNGMMSELTSFNGALPEDGTYRVRVFLGGSEAGSGRTVAFQLSLRISG